MQKFVHKGTFDQFLLSLNTSELQMSQVFIVVLYWLFALVQDLGSRRGKKFFAAAVEVFAKFRKHIKTSKESLERR